MSETSSSLACSPEWAFLPGMLASTGLGEAVRVQRHSEDFRLKRAGAVPVLEDPATKGWVIELIIACNVFDSELREMGFFDAVRTPGGGEKLGEILLELWSYAGGTDRCGSCGTLMHETPESCRVCKEGVCEECYDPDRFCCQACFMGTSHTRRWS